MFRRDFSKEFCLTQVFTFPHSWKALDLQTTLVLLLGPRWNNLLGRFTAAHILFSTPPSHLVCQDVLLDISLYSANYHLQGDVRDFQHTYSEPCKHTMEPLAATSRQRWMTVIGTSFGVHKSWCDVLEGSARICALYNAEVATLVIEGIFRVQELVGELRIKKGSRYQLQVSRDGSCRCLLIIWQSSTPWNSTATSLWSSIGFKSLPGHLF